MRRRERVSNCQVGNQTLCCLPYGKTFPNSVGSSCPTMVNFKKMNSRLTRWSLALQPFTFTIEHKKGKDNANAGTLSRMPEYMFQPLEGGENVTEPKTQD